ncbi:MAG: zeta toxin [Alphaproteobacteria bacterium]|nr:zeta toxin [Alphaproteobacteria bacterium]
MLVEKTLYLIAGPNGSGKTTLARELLNKYPDLKFMNADEVAAARNLGMVDAARIVLNDMDYTLNNGESFIWETTLSGTYHNKFLKLARDSQYKIIFSYVMLASPEQNIARVQQRVALGGHDVPDDVLRRRYLKSIMNFKPVCQMSDSWILYYNGDKKIIEIARGNGTDPISIVNDDGYKKCQIVYNSALEEIVKLANTGALHAQRVARANGINPVFEKIQSVNQKTL